MKQITTFFLFIGINLFTCTNIQHTLEYEAINQTIYQITDSSTGSEVYVDKTPISFTQNLNKGFFDNKYIKEAYGSGPVIGVDTDKINDLLGEVDFSELKLPDSIPKEWNFEKFTFPVKVVQNRNAITPVNKEYGLSKPVFTNDREYFFIYYDYYCGIECGMGSIKVFKKNGNIWELYLTLPVWFS